MAKEAAASGLYDTLQFPFNYLAAAEETALVEGCKARNAGFISMKALSGGTFSQIFCTDIFSSALDAAGVFVLQYPLLWFINYAGTALLAERLIYAQQVPGCP